MFGAGLIPWRLRSRHNFVKAHANFFFRHVLQTPPVACRPDADVAAHVLVCQRDLHMCLLAAKSFLTHARDVALVVHEDGTIDAAGRRLLAQHLPGARVVSREEADRELVPLLPQEIATARARHVLLMKVFDFNHFNAGRRMLLLDSDIVFLRPPREALAWIAGDDAQVFYNPDPMRDTYRAPNRPQTPVPDWFNSGFMGYRHHIGMPEMIDAIRAMDYALEDQTVYAYLLAPHANVALDRRRYHVYEGGRVPDEACMVHFISPDRFTDMTYVKLGRQVCEQLKRASR